MASLAALVRDHTTLDRDQVSQLNRLTSEWGMLADFCFADLLLYVPTKDDRWLIVGQVRPATIPKSPSTPKSPETTVEPLVVTVTWRVPFPAGRV